MHAWNRKMLQGTDTCLRAELQARAGEQDARCASLLGMRVETHRLHTRSQGKHVMLFLAWVIHRAWAHKLEQSSTGQGCGILYYRYKRLQPPLFTSGARSGALIRHHPGTSSNS